MARGTSVSVVVPTHDRPRLVHDAIESVVAQDHDGPLEVLVVFDNAEPHPITVAPRPGRDVRILRNDARTPGLAGARNTGILAASGDFVAFCDDDDRWMPGKLRAQLDAVESFGRDAVVGTGICVVSDDRRTVRRGPTAPLTMDDLLRDRVMELHPSTLLLRRRTLLDEVGLVDEAIPGSYAEDYELLLRASRRRPIINVPEPLVEVAFHRGSYYAANWQRIIDGLHYLLDRYPEFEQSPRGLARIQGQLAFAYAGLGERRSALGFARRALAGNPRERRAYVAILVALGLPASWVVQLARSRGRGI